MVKKIQSTNSETDFNDLAGVLNFELICRQDKNEKYSLRAFSKQIGVVSSQLSLILKKKKGLSVKKALFVGKSLGYKKNKLDWFVNLVEKDFSRSLIKRNQAKSKLKEYRNGVIRETIPKPDFKLNWYHYAIRRMTLLDDFKLEPEWVSKRLALSISEARAAIDDLKKYNLIKKKNKKYEAINNLAFYYSNEDAALKLIELNTKLSDKIHQKVLEDRSSKIYFGSHYFTIDSANFGIFQDICRLNFYTAN